MRGQDRRRFPIFVPLSVAALVAIALVLGAAFGAAAAPKPRTAAQQPAGAAVDGPAYATTHVLVRIGPQARPSGPAWDGRENWTFRAADDADQPARAAAEALEEALRRQPITAIEPALRVMPADQELAGQVGLDRHYRVGVGPGTDVAALRDELAAFGPVVERADLDGIGGVAAGGPPLPDDPGFGQLWGMHNTGQFILGTQGIPGADIHALPAWQITTGSDEILIAVLDSGLHNHIDLAGRIVPGFNVLTGDGNINPLPDCGSHGTHVTGTAAATGDNGIGVAGVTWGAKIMPVVILNDCNGLETWAADGIIYAADAGADIINLSVQYPTGTAALEDAVQYAHASGAVLVAAAGNFGLSCNAQTCVAFPARFPETIAVAATNNQDNKWSGSNEGPELSVAAPGHNVFSLTGASGTGFRSGTSMATPHVSGLAALMLTLDPSLTNEEIRGIIESTADDLGTPGFDNQFGHGRINAHAALLAVLDGLPTTPGDLTGDGTVGVDDLLILLAAWGDCPDCADCPADLTGDCAVGVDDLLILLANWG